jgi:predicted transcriptional regulator of viral defense system
MKWEEFIKLTEEYPVIELSAFFGDDKAIRVQVSQWVNAGKLFQLKSGYYILGDRYRKINPYEPHIASVLKRPSYITLEKALEFYGLIPEMVVPYTSVTTKRHNKY